MLHLKNYTFEYHCFSFRLLKFVSFLVNKSVKPTSSASIAEINTPPVGTGGKKVTVDMMKKGAKYDVFAMYLVACFWHTILKCQFWQQLLCSNKHVTHQTFCCVYLLLIYIHQVALVHVPLSTAYWLKKRRSVRNSSLIAQDLTVIRSRRWLGMRVLRSNLDWVSWCVCWLCVICCDDLCGVLWVVTLFVVFYVVFVKC